MKNRTSSHFFILLLIVLLTAIAHYSIYYGGLIRSIRVARMAELAGMPTTVHLSGGFGFVYSLHFAACTPQIGPWQEYKQGVETYGQWFDPPLRTTDSAINIPTGPGVGIVDPQEILKGAISVTS